MTPSSKAKVLTDAEMDLLRNDFAHSLAIIHPTTAVRLLATIDALTESESVLRTANDMARTELSALKAELALKDKVVEAARLTNKRLAYLIPFAAPKTRAEMRAMSHCNTRIYGELKADRDDWRSKADALSARVKDLTEGLGATVTALGHAVDIIEKHVPNDALGTNSAGGGDGWNDQSWPILDEYLHYLKEDLSKARALIGKEPSK